MKRYAILAVTFFAASIPTLGGPVGDCAAGTLADYVALGSDGCRLGGYRVFDFLEGGLSFGTDPIALADVTVTPMAGASRSSLTFSAMAAVVDSALESSIFYSVEGPLSGASLKLGGSAAMGTGVALAATEFCLGAAFDAGSCMGDTEVLIALAADGVSIPHAFTTLGVALAGVRQSLIADAGPDGSATFGEATVSFATPEPSTLLLSAFALAALARIRNHNRRSV
jgi:hypothetical protein